MKKIIIGTRGSDLALWQANFVKSELKKINIDSELKIIKTQGDKIQHLSFDKMEGKGFFTKEIEAALLSEEIDLAIHSHKDLETSQPEGLMIAAVSEREDPSELILIRKEKVNEDNPLKIITDGIIGTSSARRKALLKLYRDDLQIKDLRGNVPTRINKLREGQYDAIILANAGVSRLELDLSDLYVNKLDPKDFVSAPAQGVLAIQTRKSDTDLNEALKKLNSSKVQEEISVERGALRLLNGGCQIPFGAYCEKEGNTFKVWATLSESWDKVPKRIYLESENGEELPQLIIEELKKK